jgi:hypothetical protein
METSGPGCTFSFSWIFISARLSKKLAIIPEWQKQQPSALEGRTIEPDYSVKLNEYTDYFDPSFQRRLETQSSLFSTPFRIFQQQTGYVQLVRRSFYSALFPKQTKRLMKVIHSTH